ncbi:MAG: trypsin-like peptidase domain-containing protein [Bacteroidota bacterium]|nr:trypsin-like peptidase domain-containing protein [Bacteroidota bacterium]
MNAKTIYRLVFFLLILFHFEVSGQISQGGIPIQIQIQKLKTSSSGTADLVVMPAIDNQKMRYMYSQTNQNRLKPFRFAHSFEVSLTPQNSGKWYSDGEVNVWQLRIRSSGAYSLNLILEHYSLPDGARLFLISTKTGETKGAYTSANNSDSQVLAIEPVSGDELMVQYEEPVKSISRGEFRIIKVSHDFIGITAKDHRPLGISGSCNVNINCDAANGSEDNRDAVCRIIIEGTEICTGTLMNNTYLDGIPYVLTAYHCINSEIQAQSSVFLFNYESPYCASIDADVSRSLSGSALKASFDSLDFALVRLNTIPPYNYRTYLAGWNRKNVAPTTSMSIHHPLGDIKKVAIDQDAAVTANFNGSYRSNGFWKINRWEKGVTESGSSGGPLFDQNKQLVGTLTGGSATCTLPTNDYFEKFALAWNYRKETNKQLKAWLDPLNSSVEKLNGMSLNSGVNRCKPFTNFKDNDTYLASQILDGGSKKGYWTGSNTAGFTDFAEQYKFSKNCEVQGVTLAIGRLKINPLYPNSYIDVQVYEGKDSPETLLYSEKFEINKFYNDAMNYLPFKSPVKTVGNFFISYNISQLNPGDTLAVYMANRKADFTNSFYLKNQQGWSSYIQTYNTQNPYGYGSALLTELIACNIDDPLGTKQIVFDSPEARFFPNPISGGSMLSIQTIDPIDCPEEIAVFDLLGKKQKIPFTQSGQNNLSLDFAGKRPGIYLIHLDSGGRTVIGKVAYIP